MGIVMHYVMSDWLLGIYLFYLGSTMTKEDPIITEELLIDFRELIGEHSGHNMASAVYKTINELGLKGQVRT